MSSLISRGIHIVSAYTHTRTVRLLADINEILSFYASDDNLSATVLLNMTCRANPAPSFSCLNGCRRDTSVLQNGLTLEGI